MDDPGRQGTKNAICQQAVGPVCCSHDPQFITHNGPGNDFHKISGRVC